MNLYNLVLEQFNSALNKTEHNGEVVKYLSEPKCQRRLKIATYEE